MAVSGVGLAKLSACISLKYMDQIIIHVAGVVLGALVVSLLRLNTKRVVILHAGSISWIWKVMALIGKFLFYYGLLVFVSNLVGSGAEAYNTGIGAAIMTFGFIFWAWGGIVIYFKRN